MKTIFLSLVLVVVSVNANAEIFEVVVSKFKQGLDQKKEVELTKSLNQFLMDQAGFKSREVFYDEKQKMYVDVVAWKDEKSAKEAAEKVKKAPFASLSFFKLNSKEWFFFMLKNC